MTGSQLLLRMAVPTAALVAALARRQLLIRLGGTVLSWLSDAAMWLPRMLPQMLGWRMRTCKWCGEKRAMRYCSRCGRSVKLRPIQNPRQADPQLPGIAQAPGFHLKLGPKRSA
jgi:hypothetical protein